MPEGRLKSRTFRRVSVRIPSGKSVIQFHRRNAAKAQCANCGTYLHGVVRGLPMNISKVPRSQRRPERPYGGVLCSTCTRKTIVAKFRNIFSLSSKK